MSFHQYQEEIRVAIVASPDNRLDLFCHDVISRILPFVEVADISDMFESEVDLKNKLQREVRNYPIDWIVVGKCLDSFSKIAEQDEEHAQDMDNSIVEFLCALDNWRCFNKTGSKVAVGAVSENLMNILDFNFVGNVSLDKWLSVPELNHEFNKQIKFLRGDD